MNYHTDKCLYCGSELTPYTRSNAKYCSPSCRVRACRKRKEAMMNDD